MSAFAEALENKWEKNGMRQAEFVRVLHDKMDNQVGQILGHGLSKSGYKEGIVFKIMQILYLDDGAFIFWFAYGSDQEGEPNWLTFQNIWDRNACGEKWDVV